MTMGPQPRAAGGNRPRHGCCTSSTNRIIREPKRIFGFSGQQTGVCPVLALVVLPFRPQWGSGKDGLSRWAGRGPGRLDWIILRSRSSEVVRPKSFVRNRSCEVARTPARAKALDRNTRRPKGQRAQAMVVPDRDGTEISGRGTRVKELHDFQTNILKICDLISRIALQRLLSE
jgi:hypothetical protein